MLWFELWIMFRVYRWNLITYQKLQQTVISWSTLLQFFFLLFVQLFTALLFLFLIFLVNLSVFALVLCMVYLVFISVTTGLMLFERNYGGQNRKCETKGKSANLVTRPQGSKRPMIHGLCCSRGIKFELSQRNHKSNLRWKSKTKTQLTDPLLTDSEFYSLSFSSSNLTPGVWVLLLGFVY